MYAGGFKRSRRSERQMSKRSRPCPSPSSTRVCKSARCACGRIKKPWFEKCFDCFSKAGETQMDVGFTLIDGEPQFCRCGGEVFKANLCKDCIADLQKSVEQEEEERRRGVRARFGYYRVAKSQTDWYWVNPDLCPHHKVKIVDPVQPGTVSRAAFSSNTCTSGIGNTTDSPWVICLECHTCVKGDVSKCDHLVYNEFTPTYDRCTHCLQLLKHCVKAGTHTGSYMPVLRVKDTFTASGPS